jgi:hypothetical protein
VSHWTSGLPKLDITPFDPTPLYEAVEQTNRERQEIETRRRTFLRPILAVLGLVALAAMVMGALALAA